MAITQTDASRETPKAAISRDVTGFSDPWDNAFFPDRWRSPRRSPVYACALPRTFARVAGVPGRVRGRAVEGGVGPLSPAICHH